jgi:uncharacterized protein (TIGR00251 family)
LLEGPLILGRNGLKLTVRLTPRAKADRVLGVAATAQGKRVVKAEVTAPPEDGRANEVLLQLSARVWQLSRRDLAMVAGTTSRHKTVSVAGDPQDLSDRLGALIAVLPGL